MRLTSSSLVHAPGICQMARRARETILDREDRDRAVGAYLLLAAYPDLTGRHVEAILDGRYMVDGDAVIV